MILVEGFGLLVPERNAAHSRLDEFRRSRAFDVVLAVAHKLVRVGAGKVVFGVAGEAGI